MYDTIHVRLIPHNFSKKDFWLYNFSEVKKIKLMIQGVVEDRDSKESLPNVVFTLYNGKNEKLATALSGQSGVFSMKLDYKDGAYKLIAFKEGYDYMYYSFDLVNPIDILKVKIDLKPRIKSTALGMSQ